MLTFILLTAFCNASSSERYIHETGYDIEPMMTHVKHIKHCVNDKEIEFSMRKPEAFDEPSIKSTPNPITAAAPKLPEDDKCGGFAGKKVYIIADNGLYLARCNGCGRGSDPNSVTVHGKPGQGSAQWTLSAVEGKCVLKSDIGKYAGRCNGCWRNASSPDSVFNHVTDPSGGAKYAQWKVEKVGDKFAFQADTGKYMSRCLNCVPGLASPNSALVNYATPTGAALWDIKSV